MSALALSVLLSLVSAVAYAGGAIVQEQVAVSSPDEQFAPLRRASWWAAVALNGLGGLLHVVALAYGPLSLVQPLGALTIVFALPMAALFVGRRAGATAWRGAIMATVGLAGLLALVGTADAQSLGTAQRVGAAVVTGAAVVALMTAARAAHRHPAVRSVLLATASGIAFGMSSVFTKTVAVDWTDGVVMGDLPSLAVIAVLATAGMLLSQASYRGAGLAAPLATLTVVNPVVAAAVGITMFGETFRHGTTGTVLALSCAVVAAGGLILLTTERLARTPEPTAPAELRETPRLPIPRQAVGGQTIPGQAVGGPAVPEQALAGQAVGGQAVPGQAVAAGPEDAAPVLSRTPALAPPRDAPDGAPSGAPDLAAELTADLAEDLAEDLSLDLPKDLAEDLAVDLAPDLDTSGSPDTGDRDPNDDESGDLPHPEPWSEPQDEEPRYYSSFYGGPFVVMPVVDRHHTRVRS
ncbi:DMT family transporter [Streptomyces sp. NPDC002265]|uniref:DMT family transporter n=1 Tax=Streptomyces sp. NPDC002265 TaxID=3154415 RepID=UPI00331EA9A2